MKMNSVSTQRGFTLVEIAIVLVIISLLLGGVLKGVELIENSKVRRSVSDINGVSAAFNSYIDRYKATPGDEGPIATLQARGNSWTNISQAGNNDGRLLVNRADAFNGNNEHDDFWQHLKAAGFIAGNPSDTAQAALPRNAFGGLIGIVTQVSNATLPGMKVCLSQVPGKSAIALDTQMDDGDGATGSMRATLGNVNGSNTAPANTVLAAPYTEDASYTICTRI